jgi:hypothetical protein
LFAALTLRKAELELYMHTGLDMVTGFSMKQPLSTNAGYRCPGFHIRQHECRNRDGAHPEPAVNFSQLAVRLDPTPVGHPYVKDQNGVITAWKFLKASIWPDCASTAEPFYPNHAGQERSTVEWGMDDDSHVMLTKSANEYC